MTEQTATGNRILHFFMLCVACVLTWLILSRYSIERSGPLPSITILLLSFSLLNFWIPVKARMHFLSLASCIAAYFILDWKNATALILLMLCFSAFLSSSLKPGIKIAISLLFLALLVLLRAAVIPTPFVPYIIPIAGSFLMFRLFVMLYEMKFTKPENTFTQNFAYLFLLPNLAFPLFPIIDYKTFLRSNKTDAIVIQRGFSRITLGILQLLIYRYVHNVIIPPVSGIHTANEALLYLLSGYLVILHLTGMMWLIVGYLGILGFDLPPVFNYVFLINSPADIWRRVNIYWREFVMKLIYYPVYFRLRKRMKKPLLLTAICTFFVSGIMHGWQWFWLQGKINIQPTGIMYWTILGTCISIGLMIQDNRKAAPVRKPRPLVNVLRICGMYLFMSTLWSLWNSGNIGEWMHLFSPLKEFHDVKIIAFILFFIALATAATYAIDRFSAGVNMLKDLSEKWTIPMIACLTIVATSFVALPETNYSPGSNFLADIRDDHMNVDERENATENYYDQMLASNGTGRRPWEMTIEAPAPKSGFELACTRRHDMLMRELIPSKTTDIGTWSVVTNQWGMRDHDYEMTKPTNTLRIALLGASYEMGSGIPQEQDFENRVEQMLNDSDKTQHYEILNFAVGGYHPPQQVWTMQNRVTSFRPDVVLYFVHPEDRSRNDDYLSTLVHNGYDLMYPELNTTRNNAGARQSMSLNELKNRFEPFDDEISEWSVKEIANSCDSIHARLIIVYLPSMESDDENEIHFYQQLSSQIKFGFISLHGIFAVDPQHWKLANDPTHPNALANELIAQKLFSNLYPTLH